MARIRIFRCDKCRLGIVNLHYDPTLEGESCKGDDCDGKFREELGESMEIEQDQFVTILDDVPEGI